MTGPLLRMGYRIVATELATTSAELRMRFREKESVEVGRDPNGSLAPLGGRRVDAVLPVSVLHHIPDYLETIRLALDGLLRMGGSLASIQDPLSYPRLSRATRAASEGAYLSWRLTRCNPLRGVATRVRRLKGRAGEEHPGDVVEYHVVRDGVDELAILELLDGHFDEIHLDRYWSSQGQLQQRVGEAIGLENTFGIFASGFRS